MSICKVSPLMWCDSIMMLQLQEAGMLRSLAYLKPVILFDVGFSPVESFNVFRLPDSVSRDSTRTCIQRLMRHSVGVETIKSGHTVLEFDWYSMVLVDIAVLRRKIEVRNKGLSIHGTTLDVNTLCVTADSKFPDVEGNGGKLFIELS